MGRVAIAGFLHETNTFVPSLTTRDRFDTNAVTGGIRRGSAVLERADANSCVAGFQAAASQAGHYLVPIIYAEGDPSGTIARAFFDEVVDELCRGLGESGPLDGVLLDLHGAMVVEGGLDGDALVLDAVRKQVGDRVPIACSFDLHGNISPQTLASCDGAVAYRTYPHTDLYETGFRTGCLLQRCLDGDRLHRAHRFIPFLMPLNKQATIDGPGKNLYALLGPLEEEFGLASISLTAGFQMADIEHPLPSIFAFATDQAAAWSAVDRLHEHVLSREAQFSYDYISAAEAARIALNYNGSLPLVIADAQDSIGGGGSSDTMGVTRALLEAGVGEAAVGIIFDPDAAAAAHAAGAGAILEMQVGGRLTPGDMPLAGRFAVQTLSSGPARMTGPMLGNGVVDLGPCACLKIGGIELAVTSVPMQCLDQALFTHVGIDPARKRVLVVKDAVHFRAHFDAITGARLDVASLGADIMDYRKIPYTRLRQGTRFSGQVIS